MRKTHTGKREALKAQTLVQIILQGTGDFEPEKAAAWGERIAGHVDAGILKIHAAQAHSAQACEKRLGRNPSRDETDPTLFLRSEKEIYEKNLKVHGAPRFARARRTAKSEKTLFELMRRNALYDAFAAGAVDLEQPLAADDGFAIDEDMRCACACAVTVWLYQSRHEKLSMDDFDEDALSMMAVKACALHALGYLDSREIEKLIVSAKAALGETDGEESLKDRLPALCIAGVLSAVMFILLAPHSIAAGVAAVILGYLIIA